MSMCKLHTVKNARKAPGKCQKCGTELDVGDGYRWWKGRYTPKYVRCLKPACMPSQADRETNPLRAEHIRLTDAVSTAQNAEHAEDAVNALDEATEIAQGLIDSLDERLEGWQGTGLENAYQFEACTSTKEELERWLETVEEVKRELDAMSPTAPDESDYPNLASDDEEVQQNAQDELDGDIGIYAQELESARSGLEDAPELDLGA